VEHAFHHNGGTRDLGTLGGARSRAFDVNRAATPSAGPRRPGLLPPGLLDETGIHPLATPQGQSGTAWAINDSDLVVGHAYISASVYHATLWRDGLAHDLGTFGGQYSTAYDINAAGDIVGSADDLNLNERAALWTAQGISELGLLPGGTWSAGRAINNAGQVALWGDVAGGANHAALWDAGSVTDLGTLGGEDSWAYDLNDAGIVVGWAELYAGYYHAFAYEDGSMTDLGTLGGYFSSAYGINDRGVIVGSAQDASGSGGRFGGFRARTFHVVPAGRAWCASGFYTKRRTHLRGGR